MANAEFKHKLGLEAEDKITGFRGIIVSRLEYLFGCNQYGIAPRTKIRDATKPDTCYFDEGRIKIIGKGIKSKEVQVEKKGADFNMDAPRN